MQLARPAIAPPGETKSNVEIFRLLAGRLGFEDQCFRDTEEQMIEAALSSGSKWLEGITLDRLERERFVRLNVAPDGNPFLPFAEGGFRTPSRKFQFGAESLAYQPPLESRRGNPSLTAQYPLELVSPKNDDSMNSTFGYRESVNQQTSVCEVNPLDAASRGISGGDTVRLFNQRGSCEFRAVINKALQPGVVRVGSVRWNKLAHKESGTNALTSDRLTDIGGGPALYSCLVQLEKCFAPV
jgi:anaerobic selenocysteine-containing dehydrogenase